jgi:peptide/nickel transport system substrate-binding protein
VFAFLQKEGGDITSFTTNPLWQVVDGPFRLSQFQANGTYTYVPNKNYSGVKPHLAKVVNLFYASDVAELDSLRAGGTIDAGTLPLNDLKQAALLKSGGYAVASDPWPPLPPSSGGDRPCRPNEGSGMASLTIGGLDAETYARLRAARTLGGV